MQQVAPWAAGVALTALAGWGVYHTHNCRRVQNHVRRNLLDYPVTLPRAEMERIAINCRKVQLCTSCRRQRGLEVIPEAYQIVLPPVGLV